jgi:Lrp/AsnC family transcriptional regulator for asnA, asnC and gidA
MNYRVQIDYRALGYQTTTYVGIFLSRAGLYRDVLEQLEKVPEILECSFTTGNYSMLVKIICKDNQHLMELLSEKVQSIDGVARTETFVVLENAINRDLMLREKI